MEISEVVLRSDHPPHRILPQLKRSLSNRRLPKIFISFFLLFFVSNLPLVSPGIELLSEKVEEIGQESLDASGVKELITFLSPGLQKRQETIREIIALLERYPTGLAIVTKEELAEVIYEEAVRYDYDPKFIMALIANESSFQNWSVSEKGAKGLMQIMPYVAESLAKDLDIEWHGDRTLFNPFLNIRMGIHYLTKLTSDFDDVGLALEAYNNGPTRVKALVDQKQKVPLPFYRKILHTYENF
jgi:soluble lytic murein transglycosylase